VDFTGRDADNRTYGSLVRFTQLSASYGLYIPYFSCMRSISR
jgi:hypothetical protein